MQIVIDIPKEFEEHFNNDRFEDSLARVASDIESFGFELSGRYEQEVITMLRKSIKNADVLPKGHGRLIDADVLWDKLSKYSDNEGAKMPFALDDTLIHRDSAMFIVENAPTILEAESEDK